MNIKNSKLKNFNLEKTIVQHHYILVIRKNNYLSNKNLSKNAIQLNGFTLISISEIKLLFYSTETKIYTKYHDNMVMCINCISISLKVFNVL